jgi:diphosphomevalonate decarboxylase
MSKHTATARSHPNIAVIKYWGKRDIPLNLPAVPSISLTLSKFHSTTTVHWDVKADEFTLNDATQSPEQSKKVFAFLDLIEANRPPCKVASTNNFPTAAGLASSASAFSALAMAAVTAAQRTYSLKELSVLARQGSGSASRSLWDGWVEWKMGTRSDGRDSHGVQIAPANHWNIRMVMAVVSDQPKKISSRAGMMDTQRTSPMYESWCKTAVNDVTIGREAILEKDLHTLGTQMEHSTLKMFSTMFTTLPSIRYWKPQTLAVVECVEALRQQGTPCWYTMDAGPNVKILCHAENAKKIASAVEIIVTNTHILEPGHGTHLL